jgi:hypothetical protein
VTGASLFAKERIGFNLNLASSLLNWLNSVYRPAVPGETAEHQSGRVSAIYWGVAKW